ncbi:MAG TPA: HAD family hydrolase [Capillimicrobium sp.]|nr:HAD family hydrolase [Capillimicrobium sp.]
MALRGIDTAIASAHPVLLDALGTLVTFAPPAPRLRDLLAERHAVAVTEAEAAAAMRAEIAFYRREHDRARDRPALAALRRDCAAVLRDALPAAAHAIDVDALTPTLLDAIRFEPFPEVPAVLDELRARGHPLAVVSNWDVSLHDVLDLTGLADRVDVVVTSAELGAAKPSAAPFRAALEALGAAPAGALHAGDTVAEDVDGARAAGITPVLVDRDGAGEAPAGVAVVADLKGLLRIAA